MSNPEIEEKIAAESAFDVRVFIDSSKMFELDLHFYTCDVRPLHPEFGGGHFLFKKSQKRSELM